MKTKKFLLFAGAALVASSALVFTSCSDNDDSTAGHASKAKNENAIAFRALTPTSASTRATGITPSNYLELMKDFKVWAYFADNAKNAGSYYVGAEGENGIFINGNGKGTWTYLNSEDEQYWPSADDGALNFYAITPASNDNYVYSGSSVTYTVPTDQSKQVDLMFAQANNQLKTTNGGVVALNFQHALSQIRFTGESMSKSLKVEVKGVSIKNVINSETVNMKNIKASSLGTQRSSYSVGLASAASVSYGTKTALNDANGNLLLVPQILNKWENTKENKVATSDADAKGQSYIAVECKMYSVTSDGKKNYFLGSDTTYGTAYIPFAATWLPGNIYTYNIRFADTTGPGSDVPGGFNDGGDPIMTPITYSVSVSDWNTVDSSNL